MKQLWASWTWPVRLAGAAIALLIAFTIGSAVYNGLWWVFGGKEATKNKAEAVVQQAETEGAKTAATDVGESVVKHYEYHTEIKRAVSEGQAAVSAAYKGGLIDEEVDAAGAAALCKLHATLCRSGGNDPVEVQRADPVRTPERNPTRQPPGGEG